MNERESVPDGKERMELTASSSGGKRASWKVSLEVDSLSSWGSEGFESGLSWLSNFMVEEGRTVPDT